MNRLSLVFLLVHSFLILPGQDDSSYLGYDQFMTRVLEYHPAVNRANLMIERAEQEMRIAKGAFDPKLTGSHSQKVFAEQNYYRYTDGGITIPTRLGGLRLKAGYESASGEYQNPEFSTPTGGLWRAGAELPLGQGLFIDPERAGLRQAVINLEAAPIDKQVMLNHLLMDAADDYWNWAEAQAKVRILEQAIAFTRLRYEFIKRTALAGDMPTIDTLKAGIQLQNRQLELQRAILNLQQQRAMLQPWLWQEDGRPWSESMALEAEVLSAERTFLNIDLSMIDSLMYRHPEVAMYRYDLAWLDVEQRMKSEKLKPVVNLEYAALNQPVIPVGGEVDPRFFMDNYKWGLQVSFPLFLREARGDLGMTRIKIQETQNKQQETQQKIIARIRYYADQLSGLERQIDLALDNVTYYRRLLSAEEQQFRLGESSVFELNQWETQLIDAQLTVLSLQTRQARTESAILWSLGRLAIR